MSTHLVRLALPALALLCLAPPAAAQTWNGSTSGNWNDPNRWTPTGVPVSSSATVLTFNNTKHEGYTATFNLPDLFTVNELVFNNAAGNSIQIGADPTALTNRIRLAANGGVGPFLTVAGPRGARVSTWLDLADTVTVRGTGDGTLDLSGVVGGAGGINVNLAGGGWLSLSGSNTFTGGVTLNAGTLLLLHERGLGAGALTVNGGTLVLGTDPSKPVTNDVVTNSPLLVKTTSSNGSTLNGVISGAGGLTYDGVVIGSSTFAVTTLYLGGANTYTGPTVLRRGSLNLNGAAGALTATSSVTAFGTTLRLDNQVSNNANRLSDTAPITLHAGTLELYGNAAGTNEAVGAIGGTGHNTIALTGTGAQAITAASFDRGGARSTWSFVGLGASPGFGDVRLGAGPVADLVGGGGPAGTPTVSVLPYALAAYPSSSGMSPVTYTAAGGVRALGSGETVTSLMALSGQSTALNLQPNYSTDLITANTTVNSFNTISASVSGQATLTITSGLLMNGASGTSPPYIIGVTTVNFGAREGVILTNSGPFEILSPIAGSNGVTVAAINPNNPVIFSRANTFSGPLTVNRGRLEFSADAQLGAAGNTLALNGGGLRYTGLDATITRPISLGAATSAGPLDPGNGTVGVSGQTTTLTLGGVISGPGGVVTRNDAGFVVLANPNNTYSGNTVVNGSAKLQVASDGALGAGGPVILATGNGRGWLGITGSFTTARTIYLATGPSSPWGDRIMTDADLTVAGTIADLTPGVNGNLQKLGAARLTLAGVNTYRGTTTVSAGELVLQGNGSIATGAGTVIANNSLLRLDNSATNKSDRINGSVQFDNGGRLELVGNAGGTFETVGGFFFRDGVSVVRVTPAAGAPAGLISLSDFSASLSTGAMVLFSGPQLGAGGSQILMPNNGTGNTINLGRFEQAFGFDGTNYGMVTNDVAGIRLLNTNGATGEYVTDWSQGTFQKNVRLSNNAASGTQSANSLVLAAGGGLTIASGSSVTIDSGDILAAPGNTGITGGTLRPPTNGVVLRIYTAGDLTVGSVLGNGNTVYKGGPGALTLTGANTILSYVAYEGTLRLGAANALPAGAFVYLGPGATFDLNGFSPTLGSLYSLSPQSVLAERGAQPSTVLLGTSRLEVALTNTGNMSFASDLTGTTGGLTLSVNNTGGDIRVGGQLAYSGDTLIRGGRVYVTRTQPAGGRFVLGDGVSTVAAALLFTGYFNYLGGDITDFSRPIVVQTAAGQTATVGIQSLGNTNITLSSDITLNANPLVLRADAGSWLRQTGVISGPGRIEFLAGGLVTLAGNNTHTGGVRFTGSANVEIASDTAFGSGTVTVEGSSNTLRVQSGARVVANPFTFSNGLGIVAADDLTLTGPVTLNSSNGMGITGSGVVTVTNTVSGPGSFAKGGGGTLVLLGANTFTGGFTLDAGLVGLGSDTALGTGTLTIFNGTPGKGFRADGADHTLANPITMAGDFFVEGPRNLTFTGATNLFFGGTVTVRDAGERTAFAGPINGSAGLATAGAGTVVLSNPTGNTYTGATTVMSGTLVVSNTSGSATGKGTVTVQPGGTLGGAGAVAPDQGSQAANTVSIQGTVAPGSGVGSLAIGAAATPASVTLAGRYAWELAVSGASAAPNTGGSTPTASQDKLTVQGVLTLGAGWKLDATYVGTGFDPTVPYSWTVATATGGVTGSTAGALGTVSGFGNLQGGTFSLGINGTGDAVVLNFTPVPEPGAVLGVASALLGCWAVRGARRGRRGFPPLPRSSGRTECVQ